LPEAPALAPSVHPGGSMSSFSTYIVGFIILVVGLALAAYLLNVPAMWIIVGVVILIGIGVLMATSRTKPRDPPVA
jgi:urea transporter